MHPQSVLSPSCRRPSLTPIQNNRYSQYISVFSVLGGGWGRNGCQPANGIFEFLTVATLNIDVLRGLTPYSFLDFYQCFEETCSLHFQDRIPSRKCSSGTGMERNLTSTGAAQQLLVSPLETLASHSINPLCLTCGSHWRSQLWGPRFGSLSGLEENLQLISRHLLLL